MPALAVAQTLPDFNRVCARYRVELVRRARQLCRDASWAEDIVQQTLLQAFRRWPVFCEHEATMPNPFMHLRAWLHRIVLHVYIDQRRLMEQRRRTEAHAIFASDFAFDNATHKAKDGRDQIESSVPVCLPSGVGGVGDEIFDALERVEPEFRDVVIKVDVEQLTYEDAATALTIPLGTVMSRLYRARRLLRAKLKHYAEQEYRIGEAS